MTRPRFNPPICSAPRGAHTLAPYRHPSRGVRRLERTRRRLMKARDELAELVAELDLAGDVDDPQRAIRERWRDTSGHAHELVEALASALDSEVVRRRRSNQ